MRIAIVSEEGIVTNIIESPNTYADNQKLCYDWTQLRESYTDVEPLEHAKARYITAAKTYRDEQEVSAITYNGNYYDYDDKARERLKVARQALTDKIGATPINWTTADNTDVTLTIDDFAAINILAATRSNTLHVAYRATKAKLEAATTIEELEQIYPLKGDSITDVAFNETTGDITVSIENHDPEVVGNVNASQTATTVDAVNAVTYSTVIPAVD